MKYKVSALIILALTILVGLSFFIHRSGQHPTEASKTVELSNGQSYNLQASSVTLDINGKSQRMLAYNNSIPGPTIEVQQGSTATIKFTNRLSSDTSIHFHGIRTANASDGVVGVTQSAIKPGGSYSYKLSFPDPGVYWYHPHLREDSSQPLGLYGTIIVKSKQANYWSPVNKEVPLMVGDILMNYGKIANFPKYGSNYTLMGRYGNTMLVNGSTSYHLFAQSGEVDRYYITNVASARPFNLAIPGAKLKLVGADNGKYEKESYVDSVTLGPSERAIVEVIYEKAGTYKLQNQTPQKSYDLTTVTVEGAKTPVSYASAFKTLRQNTDTTASIEPFRAAFNKPVDKNLMISLAMGSSMDMGGMDMSNMAMGDTSSMSPTADTNKIEWEDTMGNTNMTATAKSLKWQLIDQSSGQRNNEINWQFKKGQMVKLSIYNDPNSMHPMQHPIHIHGQRFLVISTNGKPNTNLVWKDTVLVGKGDTTELLVDMSNPGNWVIHCHIPEHMESGMLLKYSVT